MKLLSFIPAAVLIAASSCTHAPEPLPIVGQVNPFVLTAQTGIPFDSQQLSGHVWVADFIFTNCEGPCPRMSAYMRSLQKATTDLPDLRMVSFTVDPERDTPPVLTKYGKTYDADPARWVFLTGDPRILDALDHDSFKLGNVGSAMDHSTRFVLIDRKGRIRGYYGIAAGDPVPAIADAARRISKEPS